MQVRIDVEGLLANVSTLSLPKIVLRFRKETDYLLEDFVWAPSLRACCSWNVELVSPVAQVWLSCYDTLDSHCN